MPSSLQQLSRDLLARILSYLGFLDLKSICLTSRLLHTAATSPKLWRLFRLDCRAVLRFSSPAVLLQVLQLPRLRQLRHVDLFLCLPQHRAVQHPGCCLSPVQCSEVLEAVEQLGVESLGLRAARLAALSPVLVARLVLGVQRVDMRYTARYGPSPFMFQVNSCTL